MRKWLISVLDEHSSQIPSEAMYKRLGFQKHQTATKLLKLTPSTSTLQTI
jgi:ethanolamine utilization microcompartment shell protein EutS